MLLSGRNSNILHSLYLQDCGRPVDIVSPSMCMGCREDGSCNGLQVQLQHKGASIEVYSVIVQ